MAPRPGFHESSGHFLRTTLVFSFSSYSASRSLSLKCVGRNALGRYIAMDTSWWTGLHRKKFPLKGVLKMNGVLIALLVNTDHWPAFWFCGRGIWRQVLNMAVSLLCSATNSNVDLLHWSASWFCVAIMIGGASYLNMVRMLSKAPKPP